MSFFHYTSIDALVGIVKSRAIWLSSLAFMNDEMEGYDLLEVLKETFGLDNIVAEQRNEIDFLRTSIETYLRWQFCFCATSLRDDLSQWRAYSPLGHGICIEFDEDLIQEAAIEKMVCIYEDKLKRQLVRESKVLNAPGRRYGKALAEDSALDEYFREFASALARFKHYSFNPEKEIRWVCSLNGLSDEAKTLFHRPHRLGLASYVEVKADLSKIQSITLGPQVGDQNLKTIEDFLIQHDCGGYVTRSQVSLR